MNVSAKQFLTVAALTNPLLWFVAALGIALATVGLGVLLLWGIYRYLRHEWTIPVRPKPVSGIDFQLADPPVAATKEPPIDLPLFGVELPRPLRATAERRVAILAAERAEPTPILIEATPALDGHMAHERLVVKGQRQDGARKQTARPRVVSSASRTTKKAESAAAKPKGAGLKKQPRPTKAKVQKA